MTVTEVSVLEVLHSSETLQKDPYLRATHAMYHSALRALAVRATFATLRLRRFAVYSQELLI